MRHFDKKHFHYFLGVLMQDWFTFELFYSIYGFVICELKLKTES